VAGRVHGRSVGYPRAWPARKRVCLARHLTSDRAAVDWSPVKEPVVLLVESGPDLGPIAHPVTCCSKRRKGRAANCQNHGPMTGRSSTETFLSQRKSVSSTSHRRRRHFHLYTVGSCCGTGGCLSQLRSWLGYSQRVLGAG